MNSYSWLYDLIKIMAATAGIRIHPHELFKRALRGEDVLLALCLLDAPKLERLWYRYPVTKMPRDMPSLLPMIIASRVFLAPVNEQCRFKNLKILHIDLYKDRVEWPASNALAFLFLPSLIDLILGGWVVTGPVAKSRPWEETPDNDDSACMGKPWIWPVRSSCVTRLSLLRPFVSGTMIAKMLHACRSISRFEERQIKGGTWYRTVETALLEHVDTLSELSLGDVFDSNGHRRSDTPGTFSAGPRLTHIKSLRTPLYTLIGYSDNMFAEVTIEDERASDLANALPQSIEHLRIQLPHSLGMEEGVECYFIMLYRACKDGRFPELRTIYLHRWLQYDSAFNFTVNFLKHITGLQRLFRKCSVSFDVHMLLSCEGIRGA
jgi:hypothetical protein